MKAKKRLEISLETYEITTINFKQGFSAKNFCQLCDTETLHLSVGKAAAVTNISEAEIFRLTESGKIHCFETETGVLLVCFKSMESKTEEKLWDL